MFSRNMDTNRLLYPDLLSDSEIVEILETLCIKISEDLPRSRLLEIFNKVALPLPQRRNQKLSKTKETFTNLDELAVLNVNDHDIEDSRNAKRMKYQFRTEQVKRITDINSQLSSIQLNDECKKTLTNSQSIFRSRKVTSKRTHLFQKDDDTCKRIKLR